MYFSLLTNDWNYNAFDESLALLDQLKKQQQKLEKEKHSGSSLQMINSKSRFISNNAHIKITHVAYLLFMLTVRMFVYHMYSVLLFLALYLVDLGPLQNLRWSSL